MGLADLLLSGILNSIQIDGTSMLNQKSNPMKSPISIIILLTAISVTATVAQDKKKEKEQFDLMAEMNKVFSTKVDMDVDTTIFETRQGNMYISESEKAFIMTMVAPQSIAKAEEQMNEPDASEDYKILEKKKIMHEGRTILFQKAEAEKEGQKAIVYIYQIEATPESSILISATQLNTANEKVFKAIQRAAYSAKLADKDK